MLYWEVGKISAGSARRRGQAWLSAKPCGCMVAASAIESSPCGVVWRDVVYHRQQYNWFVFIYGNILIRFACTLPSNTIESPRRSRKPIYSVRVWEGGNGHWLAKNSKKNSFLGRKLSIQPGSWDGGKKPGTVRTVSDPIPPWDDCHRWKQIGCTLGSGHYRGMVLTGDVTVIKIDAWVPSPRRIGSGAGCRTVATSSGVWRIDVRTYRKEQNTRLTW